METGKLVAFEHDHASPCFAEQGRRGAAGGAAADNRNIITFHRQKVAEFAGKQRVAHASRVLAKASRVLAKASRLRGLFCKDCFGETPKPARGTRALPGTLRGTRRFTWFETHRTL